MYNRVCRGLLASTADMNTAAVNTRTATPEEDLILVLALSMGNRKLAVAVSRTEMRGVIW